MRARTDIPRVRAHRSGRHANHPTGVPAGAARDGPDRFALPNSPSPGTR
ncbi:hypothetical protein [Streptomyces zaomyceticus]|nr:hypothetical protein OG237_38765 [Streptomyces zaomyceticus]